MAIGFLRKLRLKELSLVTKPANQHSHVVLHKMDDEYWKRDFSQDERDAAAESGAAMSDGSFPIKTVGDLKNAIRAVGRAKDIAAARRHIISRARALGATDQLPDSWNVKKALVDCPECDGTGKMDGKDCPTCDGTGKAVKDGGDHVGKERQMADETKKVADLEKTVADLTKSVTDLTGKVTEMTKRAETAEAKVAEIVKSADDEVITVAGVEIKKSVFGEKAFTAVKASQAEAIEERNKRELVEFEKTAETSYAYLPGKPAEKAKVLKSLSVLPKEERESLEKMLKASNVRVGTAMKETGYDGGDPDRQKSDDPIEQLVITKMAADTKLSRAEAYNAVMKTKEGKAAYAQQNEIRKQRAAGAQ